MRAWFNYVAIGALIGALGAPAAAMAQDPLVRQREMLDRGAVAAPALGGGMLVSWRLLAEDCADLGFNVYRNGQKLNDEPVITRTNLVDRDGKIEDRYEVRALSAVPTANAQAISVRGEYLAIPLVKPEGGTTPTGQAFTYTANDGSVGDLDGDGQLEVVIKWDPTNSQDNSVNGYTGATLLDAYSLDGRRLWRIDLGPNIRSGAHYTNFFVFDFDGDGRSEVAVKTGDGTVDGEGRVIGDATADWRETPKPVPPSDANGVPRNPDGSRFLDLTGRILSGPEYLTIFDGKTGRALATEPFGPIRHPDTSSPTPAQMNARWGDGYGNRSERYLGGVAFLDGTQPSIIMARGYYGRTTVAAWDWRGGQLSRRWLFETSSSTDPFSGQGNHQLGIADVDEDGRDEIIYGAMALDDDGGGLWTSGLGHGDAMHVSDLDPTRPGLEKFGVHEGPRSNGGIGAAMLDARTGAVLWSTPAADDVGRGVAMDIDPTHVGAEAWSNRSLFNARGLAIGESPKATNFGIWWDGDLLRELLDGIVISKWNWITKTANAILTARGSASNNGSKATPVLSADILGDWREELILRSADSSELRIYVTPYPTDVRMVTLMSDPVYRASIAWQNTAYNQPPHTGFYLGEGMKLGER